MDKSKAIELLKQALAEIPHLRVLHYDNQEFKLWLHKVETIIINGLDEDDYNTFSSVQSLYFLEDLGMDDLLQGEDYPKRLKGCETALKSIIHKYEILGIEGERDKGGEVKKMDKKGLMDFLNEKMQEIYDLETSPPNNTEFPKWYKTIEGFLFKVFGKDSWEYTTFKEAGIIRGIVEDSRTQYLKSVKSRETALASIINTHEHLGDEESLEQKEIVKYPIHLFDAMQFHPKVVEASRSCFVAGNYREAILNAFICLIDYVKERTGLDLDGDDLMNQVFSINYDKEQRRITKYPIIRINELKNKSDRDEQQGFMFLCKGAAGGIRNPKAHKLIPQSNPLHTLEYLAFASLLIRRIEEGKVVKPQEGASS